MEDKSELIKTFLMSVEFYGRDDIEIIVYKERVDFYRITIYTHLGPNDGIYSRIIKTIDMMHNIIYLFINYKMNKFLI
jgi:hypothetical protein